MDSGAHGATFECDGCCFAIEVTDLVVGKDGTELMRLPLVPKVEGEGLNLTEWQQVADAHWRMDVDGFGSLHVGVREGHACYWIETGTEHFRRLTFFPDSRPTETRWHTFWSDELDRAWTIDENANVPLSSAYYTMHPDGEDGAGMTDPGDKPPTWIWNIPTRAFAVETPSGWMGISIPGPLSVGMTRLTMQRGLFNVTFEELRPTAAEWGAPRVYFIPGLADPYDTLDEHRLISEACGLIVEHEADHPDWWGYPSFKAADEVLRANGGQWMLTDDEGNVTSYLTTENWLRWIDHVEQYAGLSAGMNLQLDQLYFRGYGAREAISTLGGNEGLRKTVDALRERNMRVGFYTHLFQLDPDVTDFPARHPEAICKPKDPGYVVHSGVTVGKRNELVYADWTHPAGREHMLSLMEWIVSDKPGCLNADILLINNVHGINPARFEFHDPDWGTGDLMQMKATKLVYEHVKRIKPHAMVRRQSPGDSYMQPYYDMANMCEEWNGHTRAWYRRAHIGTRVLQDCILHLDAWFVTLTKLTEYYFAMAAICPPEIESVRHAIHPYMYWRDMREKDYRRIRAGVQTYLNAPCRRTDRCRVNYREPDHLEIWRKRTAGPLAGWYAARALHKRAFVTYSETEARIGASQERHVTVPLPPGSRLVAVQAVPHEGEPVDHPYDTVEQDGAPAVRLWAADGGGDVMYVSLRYTPGR